MADNFYTFQTRAYLNCQSKLDILAKRLNANSENEIEADEVLCWALDQALKVTDPFPKNHACADLDNEQLMDEIEVLECNLAATLQVVNEYGVDEVRREATGIQAELDQLKAEAKDRGLQVD